MGEPPRLPAIYLPWEENVAYFVTLCVKDRLKVLASDTVFEAVKAIFPRIRRGTLSRESSFRSICIGSSRLR
jgi:hypothetical protein